MIGPIAVSIAFVMELTLVPLLLPSIQREFDLSIIELAWIFNFYGIAVAIAVLLSGWLGDLFDTEKVFAFGVIIFAAGSTFAALSDSYLTLVIGRALQGFGAGIFSPLVPILLTRAAPHRPGKVLIVWGSLTGYAAFTAPLIYGNLLPSGQWRVAFISFTVISVTALLLLQMARLSADALLQKHAPINFRAFFRSYRLWLIYLYIFATYGSFTYYLFHLPLWMSDTGYSPQFIAIAISTIWLSFSIVSTSLRNLVDRSAVKQIMLTAPLLIAAGYALSYFCSAETCTLLSSVLIGSALACGNSPSTQLVLRFAPDGMNAIAASIDITSARLGGVALVAILAPLNFGAGVIVISLMCLFALATGYLATRSIGPDRDPNTGLKLVYGTEELEN